MTYYPTLEKDLARAKKILAESKPSHDEVADLPDPIRAFALAGGAIRGADAYAAYKLLESFVALIEQMAPRATELDTLQRGLSRLDPMQRSSPETLSCVFCGADKTFSYVTGNRTPHAADCAWRLACEARGIPWDHVL